MTGPALDIRLVPISKIDPWDKNPRDITPDGLARLKAQIKKLGVYKPLLCYPEKRRFVTLGGNMRIQAFRDLGFTEVEISLVRPKSEAEKLEYSLSDNDRAGHYVLDRLGAALADVVAQIDLSAFQVDLGAPTALGDVLAKMESATPVDQEFEETVETGNECPKCGYKW
jgi:ParB-like chromosome segregation protein Spo0J